MLILKGGENMKCLEKIKSFLVRNKVAVTVSAVASAMSVVAVNAFAAEAGSNPDIGASLTSGFQSCVNDLLGYAVAVVPVAITAFGTCWAIKKCIDLFKNVTGKGT